MHLKYWPATDDMKKQLQERKRLQEELGVIKMNRIETKFSVLFKDLFVKIEQHWDLFYEQERKPFPKEHPLYI